MNPVARLKKMVSIHLVFDCRLRTTSVLTQANVFDSPVKKKAWLTYDIPTTKSKNCSFVMLTW